MNQAPNFFSTAEFNPHNYATTPEIDQNLSDLHEKMNELRAAYGKPMKVTSCLRSMEQQKALIAQGKSNAPKSKHLVGAAIDILDESGDLNKWCKANIEIMKDIGLYMEERQGPWQHFQIIPPASGNRWFKP